MLRDARGLQVSTNNPEVIKAIDDFTFQLSSLGANVTDILKAVERFPESALLQIFTALFYLYAQTERETAKAAEHLRKVNLKKLNPREKSLYLAAKLWQERNMNKCLDQLEKHALRWKKDLAAIKVMEFLYYCNGQQYNQKRFLRLAKACLRDNANEPHFLSIYSFALELNGNYKGAEEQALRSIDLDPINPWAHHTLTHVYLLTGRVTKGAEVIEKYAPSWIKSNRLILSHNMWHLALFYFENCDWKKTMGVYKRADWDNQSQFVGEEIDAAALLWRLDMEGHEENGKWKKLAEAIDGNAAFIEIPFITSQLSYALHRGGRKDLAREALTRAKHRLSEIQGKDLKVWKKVGIPLVEATIVFADKDYKTAAKLLDPAIDEIGCVGGSDAQIALFQQAYFKSLVGAHRYADARAYLRSWIPRPLRTPLEKQWLAEAT